VFYEHGYLGTTSKRIATTAGVSSSAFYRFFDDVSDCLHAAFDVAAKALLNTLADRCQEARGRRGRARSYSEALLAFHRSEPQLARLLGTELSAAERGIASRRRQLIDRLGQMLDEQEEKSQMQADAVSVHLAAAALALSCNGGADRAAVPPGFSAQLPVLLDLAGGRAE
jgi:AcrR family transcriptional regulator